MKLKFSTDLISTLQGSQKSVYIFSKFKLINSIFYEYVKFSLVELINSDGPL